MTDLRPAAARIPYDWLWYDPDGERYFLWNSGHLVPDGPPGAPGGTGPDGATVTLRSVMGATLSLPTRMLSAHEVPAAVVTVVLALALEDALNRFGAGLSQLASRDPASPARDLAALAAETDAAGAVVGPGGPRSGGALQPVVERLLARLGEPTFASSLNAMDDALRLVTGTLTFGPATEGIVRAIAGLFSPEHVDGPEDDVQARVATEVSRDLAERAAARGDYALDLTNIFASPASVAEGARLPDPCED